MSGIFIFIVANILHKIVNISRIVVRYYLINKKFRSKSMFADMVVNILYNIPYLVISCFVLSVLIKNI